MNRKQVKRYLNETFIQDGTFASDKWPQECYIYADNAYEKTFRPSFGFHGLLVRSCYKKYIVLKAELYSRQSLLYILQQIRIYIILVLFPLKKNASVVIVYFVGPLMPGSFAL